MRTFITLLLCGTVAFGADRAADHAELRKLMIDVAAALNANDLEALHGKLATPFSITFADQKRFTDIEAIRLYDQELRNQRKLTKATFAPTADELTTFIGADAGVCTGTSTDTFTFSNGSTTVLQSRWTATLARQDGAWKVAALHAGVDLLDNPVLRGVKDAAMRLALVAAIVAALVGVVAGVVFGRRRAR